MTYPPAYFIMLKCVELKAVDNKSKYCSLDFGLNPTLLVGKEGMFKLLSKGTMILGAPSATVLHV